PDAAVTSLDGKVYSKRIPRDTIDQYRAVYPIISTQLKAGGLHIRILADQNPGNGFQPSPPNLEDVYFSHIATKMDVLTI
ncbi:MAG TPA: hypothetical protein VKQ52_20150, partial [Puia sp.]|nr:hypothetical protein [Puia sp.]